MNIVLVGAGNVATHLGVALQTAGFSIVQIYSRTEHSASLLSNRLKVPYTTDIQTIIPDADGYIFSVKDDAIVPILQQIKPIKGLCAHTAGSVPANIFQPYVQRYGVFYPLQTFSKEKDLSFRHIPILYEANSREDEDLLQSIAASLSDTCLLLDSEKRKYLHLAASFACNFTNHMYTLAAEILERQDISRDLLLPLIEETASKIHTLHPKDAQTGPAIRQDTETMQKHLELLSNENKKEIYKIISESIVGEGKR